jgi:predicted kinase
VKGTTIADPIARCVLAEVPAHADRWRQPVLVALMGLPGTGKSVIAAHLASRLPLTVLSTDAIRLHHGLPSGPATHAVIYEVAAALLAAHGAVVWDGIHPTLRHRATVRAFAADHGAHFELVHTVADDATVRARLDRRAADPVTTAAEGKFVITPEKLTQLAAWLEPPGSDEPFTLIDTTDGPLGGGLEALEQRLGRLIV